MCTKHHLAQGATDLVKDNVSGFRQFIEKQNVLGIAIGLAVGSAASTLATSFVNNMIMAPIGYFFGSTDGLRGLYVTMGEKNGELINWHYGVFLSDFINFLVIALVFYLVIKFLGLDNTGKKKNAS